MGRRIEGAVRLVLLVAVLAGAALVLCPLQGLARRRGWRLARGIPVLFCRALCACLNVRPRFHGRPADGPVLLAPNHVSWIDVPALGCGAPVAFIAKSDVARWPLVGALARAQGAVFVERGRRTRVRDGNARIARRLLAGQPVVLFAEGTTGCGSRLRPFRTSHFEAARDALRFDPSLGRAAVQPVSVAYTRRNGLPLGRHGRPDVAWYGDMTLLPHLWGLLTSGPLDCDVTFLEPIPVGPDTDRKVVGRAAERAVRRATADALTGRGTPATPGPGRWPVLIGEERS